MQRASKSTVTCFLLDSACCTQVQGSQSASSQQANTGKMYLARAVLRAKGLSPPQRLHRQAATERAKSACGDGAALRSVAPKNKFFLIAVIHVLLKKK